jgi:hypothetical protein
VLLDMLLPYGEWDSPGRFLPGTEDCKLTKDSAYSATGPCQV